MNTPQDTPNKVNIIYKPGPDLFVADWLSKQNQEDKDEEITGAQVNIDTTEIPANIPECMIIHEWQHETALDNHLQQLKECIIKGWPENKGNVAQNLK